MRKAQFYQEFTVTTVHQMSILVMNVINRDPPEYLILVVHLVETIYPKIQKPLFQRLRAASNSRIGDEEYRPTTSTRDYTSNFTPSSRYEGFGSQGFSRNGGDHPSRSGFFPKKQSSGFGSSNGF